MIPVQSDSSDVECIEAPKPLGDVFESVAGAIFLDSGLDIYEVWKVYYPMLKDFIGRFFPMQIVIWVYAWDVENVLTT